MTNTGFLIQAFFSFSLGLLSSSPYRPEEQGHDLPFRDEEHRGGESDPGRQEEDDVDPLGRTGNHRIKSQARHQSI